MESICLHRIPIFPSSKALTPSSPHFLLRFPKYPCFGGTRCLRNFDPRKTFDLISISFAGNILWGSPPAPVSTRFACISSSAALSGSRGGAGDGLAGGGGGGGGGGGDGGSSDGKTEVKSLAGEPEEASVLEPDVIVLHVGGMTCGGCAASVKRILESQPQVSSAVVNLETETAVVWAAPEVKVMQQWQRQLGEKLANHLTTCGFKSDLQANIRIAGRT